MNTHTKALMVGFINKLKIIIYGYLRKIDEKLENLQNENVWLKRLCDFRKL